MLTVLSIDWDYFVDANAHTRGLWFPDGNQFLPDQLDALIWASKYAYSNGLLESISIKKEELKICKKFYDNVEFKIAAKNHDALANVLIEHLTGEKLRIINIDFHHDLRKCTEKDQLDAGNWLGLIDHANMLQELIWISHTDSLEPESIQHLTCKKTHRELSIKSLNITPDDIDLVFVCLSPPWSPPHLDKVFIKSFQVDHNDRWPQVKKLIPEFKKAETESIVQLSTFIDNNL